MRVVRTLWDTGVCSSWVGRVFQVGRVCISYFFYYSDKLSDKGIQGKKVLKEFFLFFQNLFIYVLVRSLREAGQQGCEAAGHVSTGSKQWGGGEKERDGFWGSMRLLRFTWSGDPQPVRLSHPPSGWVFPSWLYFCANTLADTPRGVLLWGL